jgi:hypothetical protein
MSTKSESIKSCTAIAATRFGPTSGDAMTIVDLIRKANKNRVDYSRPWWEALSAEDQEALRLALEKEPLFKVGQS